MADSKRPKPPGGTPGRPVLPLGAPVREKVRGVNYDEDPSPTAAQPPLFPDPRPVVGGRPPFPATLPPAGPGWVAPPQGAQSAPPAPPVLPGAGQSAATVHVPQPYLSPAASAQLAQAQATQMTQVGPLSPPQPGQPGQPWLAMTQINMQGGPMTMMGAAIAGSPSMAVQTQVVVSKHSMPEEVDPRLIMVREPDSARAAAFRVLRHRLVERGDPRTICVTSAEPAEGKTTLAINLAMALGECGRARVLLMEANLRSPRLAPMLGFRPPECFSEQLARHREQPLEPWSVVEVFWPWLHVAAVDPKTAGKPLLDAPAFEIAVARLRPGYDYLVIDTPPVLGSADVNLIEDAVEAVLLACWAKRSRGRTLARAIEQLSPAKVIGVTLLDA